MSRFPSNFYRFWLTFLLLFAFAIASWLGETNSLSAQAPRTGIHSPSERDRVSGAVPISGTAVIGNFVRYELEYRPAGRDEEAFVFIASGDRQVVEGLLGTWQTHDLSAGLYTLRLRAVRSDGNYIESVVHNVIVDPTLRPTVPSVSHPPKTGGVSPAVLTLTAKGVGRVTAEPDRVIIDFYPDPAGGADRFDTLVGALIAGGISADDIQTDLLARGSPGTLGLVRVIDERPELVESLIDQIISVISEESPLLDIVVRLGIETCEEELALAARRALDAAEDEARILATALGVELGTLVSVSRTEPTSDVQLGCYGGDQTLVHDIDPANSGQVVIVVALEATYRVSGVFSTEGLTPTATPTLAGSETPTPDPLITATETPVGTPPLTPTSTPTVDPFATPTQTPNTSIVPTATPTITPTVFVGSPVETPTP